MSSVVTLTVPGELVFRDIAIGAVAAACRLVREGAASQEASSTLELSNAFDAEMVSAVSEIFNNIVIHGYQAADSASVSSQPPPPIHFELHFGDGVLLALITDHGAPFNIEDVPAPELDTLPEGGMGIHIARSFLDELNYEPGPPNVWRLKKNATPSVAP